MDKETNYPSSCKNCPNNPDNYENLTSRKDIELSLLKIQGDIEFDKKFVSEMGGDEDNTL